MRAAALLAALLALLAAGPARAGPPDGIVPPVWDASLAYRAGAAGGACLLVVAALVVAVRRSALRGGCLHRALQRLDDDRIPDDAGADAGGPLAVSSVPMSPLPPSGKGGAPPPALPPMSSSASTLPQPVGKAVAAPQAARPVLYETQTAPIALTPEVRKVRHRVALLGYAAACLMAFVAGALCVLAGELLSGARWLIWEVDSDGGEIARFYFRDHPWVDKQCPTLLLDIPLDERDDNIILDPESNMILITITMLAPICFFTLAMVEKVVVGLMLELDIGRWRNRWGFVVRRRNSNYGTASRVMLLCGAFLCMDPIIGLETDCQTELLSYAAAIFAVGNVASVVAAVSLVVQRMRPGCTSGWPKWLIKIFSALAYIVAGFLLAISLVEFPPSTTFSIPQFTNEPGVISTLKVGNLLLLLVDLGTMLLVSRGAGGFAFERSVNVFRRRGGQAQA